MDMTITTIINKKLNEDFNKFSFNKKIDKKINFDKKLIEKISTQLVMSAYVDLQKDYKKLNRLNENMLSNVASSLGSGLGEKIFQGGKEALLTGLIGKLGFDENSFTSLLLINIFANLAFKDYGKFFTECNKFTEIIIKSALEAWLDLGFKNMGGSKGSLSMEGFIYSALKNVVTETAAGSPIYKKMEGIVFKFICPLVENLAGDAKNFLNF